MKESITTCRTTRSTFSKRNYCKIIKVRFFRAKSPLIVILWIFTATLNVATDYSIWSLCHDKYSTLYLGIAFALTFPIAIFADLYFGRYKIIQYSLRLLWLAVIICNGIIIIQQYVLEESKVLMHMFTVCMITGITGSAGILVNSLQFGIDQLIDASSAEITSYISWIAWILSLALTTGILLSKCLGHYYGFTLLYLTLPLFATLSFLADLFLSHLLVKEPATNNPFKLIYRILKYAAKNKYPRLRSAFTYWEDRPISRLDLGKRKFGGPFTTEQVEDVKTFFRILGIIIAYIPISALVIGLHTLFYVQYFNDEILDKSGIRSSISIYIKTCYYETAILELDMAAFIILIPVIETILYPLIARVPSFANFSIMNKLFLGILLIILYEISLLGIELGVIERSDVHNASCFFYVNGNTLGLHWLIAPKILYSVAVYVIFTSSMEFIVAQTPYSMRGLLFGVSLLLVGLSEAVFSLCYMLVTKVRIGAAGLDGANCEIFLYGFLLFLTIVLLFIVILMKKCYKQRTRDEDLPNEQKFVVDYYDKYISMSD